MKIPGLKELWAETLGDPRVCVAILDGPVDQSHPSLAVANLTQLKTLVSSVVDQGAASQHGTQIASVIFGQHDGPIKGIAPPPWGKEHSA
jgi:subtilisin family serine protease